MQAPRGTGSNSSYSFLTSALGGVSGQRHASAALYLRGRTLSTNWTGGWVGLIADLNTEAKGNICLFQGSNSDSPVQHYTD
jgi:hypothetical protein